MAAKKQRRGKKSSLRRPPSTTRTRRETGATGAVGPDDDPYVAAWVATRSGANAARGFHYQDTVGAWLALQVAGGALDGVLVPEGLDDMVIESDASICVQVKSRVLRRGPFRPAEAAGHALDAWLVNAGRPVPASTVWVALENGVDSVEVLDSEQHVLLESLQADSPLNAAIAAAAAQRLEPEEAQEFLRRTVLLGLSWADLEARVDARLVELTDLAAAGRAIVARSIRVEIADATDANTTLVPAERRRLDRTSVVQSVHSSAEQIDVDALEVALRDGLCAPLDRSIGADTGDEFYEGVSCQPGHVASGLVVPRPELLSEVIAAIDAANPVIITGPSGVGKSALMWMVPEALPGVVWFRVLKLQTGEDANLLLRLARAYAASPAHPIGFLVDGAGLGNLTGWEYLRSASVAQPGVVLVATARNEDVVHLGDLADTGTIEVGLDEASAATIFDGLQRRGVALVPHWQEAFQHARGLTLEFTYLLTQGRRLRDVVGDQVQRRVTEGRGNELAVLALVSVADQWSATVEISGLAGHFGDDDASLRQTIDILVDEHLLIEYDGTVSGLHPVRSAAIAEAIHATPPPTLGSTVSSLLPMVHDDRLPGFIAQALRSRPDLSDTTIDAGRTAAGSASRLTGFLQGLRRADSGVAIREWVQILDELAIPRSIQMPTVLFTLAGLELGGAFRADVRRAQNRMTDVQQGDLRDRLADLIGVTALSELVFGSPAEEAIALVATLQGWKGELTLPLEQRSLLDWLQQAPSEQAAEVMAALRRQSEELHVRVVDDLGGETAMLARLRSENPWLIELDVRPGDSGPIGFARFLHVDDHDQGSPRERCVSLAQTLLRLLPSIDEVDVEALAPGGQRMEFGGYVDGQSGLQRRHDHDRTEQAWHQTRFATAQELLGASDTVRLAIAAPVFEELADVVGDFCNRWVRQETATERDRRLYRDMLRIHAAGEDLPPALVVADEVTTGIVIPADLPMSDPLSDAITHTVRLLASVATDDGRALLASHIRRDVIRPLAEASQQPWHLIADGQAAIESLDRIVSDVSNLRKVLRALAEDPSSASKLRIAGTTGSMRNALSRSAKTATELLAARTEAREAELLAAVCSAVPACEVEVRAVIDDALDDFVVLVDGPSLDQWLETEQAVVTQLNGVRETGETFVVIPLRHGKRTPGMGLRLIDTPMPLIDVAPWEAHLPEAHELTVAPLLSEATHGLSALSGIADLPDDRRSHPEVIAVAAHANDRLNAAVDALLERRGDPFVDLILDLIGGLADRVEAELEAERPPSTLAQNLSRGVLGVATPQWEQLIGAWILAVEWELDPEPVRQSLQLS